MNGAIMLRLVEKEALALFICGVPFEDVEEWIAYHGGWGIHGEFGAARRRLEGMSGRTVREALKGHAFGGRGNRGCRPDGGILEGRAL